MRQTRIHMSDVRGQLTADRQPARELMRFAQTGPDESFADIHRVLEQRLTDSTQRLRNSCGSTALFTRLLSLASRSIARRLLRAREALILSPAFGTFPSVVSAFVMSHKPDLRPLLEREQSKRLG